MDEKLKELVEAVHNETLRIAYPHRVEKFWATLLKKRDPGAEVYVFCDEGDRRALSLCYSVCDLFRLPRSGILLVVREEQAHAGPAPNVHVYDMVKSTRGMVVG